MKLKFAIYSVLLIVTLPSVTMAQQSNQQASLLIELQNLRQEVAELRDMVERQQFQIRKLQQQNSTPTARPQMPQSTSQQPWQNPSQQPAYDQSQASQSEASQPAVVKTPNYQDRGYVDNGAQTNAPVRNPQTTQTNSSEYYRQGAPSNPEQTNSARDYAEQQAQQQYPPVVDRSIGGSPQVANDSRFEAAPTTQQRPAYPANGQTTPPNNNNTISGGVISVPSTRPQVSQSTPSQPVSSQVTTREAIPAISEMDFYQQGFDLLKKSKEEDAVAVFRQQLATYPNGEYAADAYFWIADSMYVNRKLDESKKNFRQIMDNFKQSPRVPFAMLKTAYIEQEQGNVIEARMLLQEIIQHYPQSDAAISAKNRIATLK